MESMKIVVMVIDGLRTDHVLSMVADLDNGGAQSLHYNNKMPYVSKLLQQTQDGVNKKDKFGGGALGFELITSMPTVTAPRIQVTK